MLREYQIDCLRNIKKFYENGVTRQLINISVGGGKTLIMSYLPKILGIGKKMLVLAHRDILVRQNKNKIQLYNPYLDVQIEQGDKTANNNADVIVASSPTLASERIKKFDPAEFGIIVTDEGHHGVTSQNMFISKYFGVEKKSTSRTLHIGMTGTANRLDRVGLGNVYDELVYSIDTLDLIKKGYLVPIRGYRVVVDIGGRDARGKKNAVVVDSSEQRKIIVDAIHRYANDRQIIVFCQTIDQAKKTSDALNCSGVNSCAISGKITGRKRQIMLERFENREIQCLTTHSVLMEGVDIPIVDCIVLARRTKSHAVYCQQIGRGLRLAPGKKDCVILDIVGNTLHHDIVTLPTLFGLPVDFDFQGRDVSDTVNEIGKAEADVDIPKHIQTIENFRTHMEKVDIMKMIETLDFDSRYSWTKNDEHYEIMLPDKGKLRIMQSNLGYNTYYFKHGDDLPELISNDNNIRNAVACADSWIESKFHGQLLFIDSCARWRTDPVSEKQLNVIQKLGFDIKKLLHLPLTKGTASDIIKKYTNYVS